jgi:hypothetical protein
MDEFAVKGTHDFRQAKDTGKGGETVDNLTLEGFSINTLYDKLEDQTIHVNAHLQAHEQGFLDHYRKLGRQCSQLKALLVAMMEKVLSKAEMTELQGWLTDLHDEIKQEGLEEASADRMDMGMLSNFQAFAKKSNSSGGLMDSLEPETAQLLAGVLGMAGGLTMKDGVVVVSAGANGAFGSSSGGFESIRQAPVEKSSSISAVESMGEHNPETRAMSEAVSSQDEQVLAFVQAQREKANQLLLAGDDEEARRILLEVDRYREDAARKLADEAARQRRMVNERTARRRKSKAKQLQGEQAAEKAEIQNMKMIEDKSEGQVQEAIKEISEFISAIEGEQGGALQQLRVDLADYGDDSEAVARALREYQKSNGDLQHQHRAALAAKEAALRRRLASRKNEEKNELDFRHDAELKTIAADEPDQIAQVQLRHEMENTMLEAEHRAAEVAMEDTISGMSAVLDAAAETALTTTIADVRIMEDAVAKALRAYENSSGDMKEQLKKDYEAKQEALRKRRAGRAIKEEAVVEAEQEVAKTEKALEAQVAKVELMEETVAEATQIVAEAKEQAAFVSQELQIHVTEVEGLEDGVAQALKDYQDSSGSMREKHKRDLEAKQEALRKRLQGIPKKVEVAQEQLQVQMHADHQKSQAGLLWHVDALTKNRLESKNKMQLEKIKQLEQIQLHQLDMAKRSEQTLDGISKKNADMIHVFIQAQQTKADGILQNLQDQAKAQGNTDGPALASLLVEFEAHIKRMEDEALEQQKLAINQMVRSMKDDHEERCRVVRAEGQTHMDPLLEARELQELEHVMEMAARHMSDHENTLEASLRDLLLRLSTAQQTIFASFGHGNSGKSVAEIMAEVEQAHTDLKAGSDQQFADRKAGLQRQLDARKARRSKELERKHEEEKDRVTESTSGMSDAELQAKHSEELMQLQTDLNATDAAEEAALEQIDKVVEQEMVKVNELLEHESAVLADTIKRAESMDAEERQALVDANRNSMAAMREDYEIARQQQQDDFDAKTKNEISTRDAKAKAKCDKMNHQWEIRAAEDDITTMELRLGELVQERAEAMTGFQASIETKAQEQYMQFVSKLEESQAATLQTASAEVDASLTQLNASRQDSGSAAFAQLKEQAKNRYEQVQTALTNEKARQLAVFHTKQDERKKRKIEFEFGKREEMQNKIQELHNTLKKGQEIWAAQNANVAKLVDQYMNDEAQKAREITNEKQDAEALVAAKYQAEIAANPNERNNLVARQTEAVAELHASKVRELQLMSQQQALNRLSALDDLIDEHQTQLATQLATEAMLKKIVRQLELEASNRSVDVEMDMNVETPPALLQKLEAIKAEHAIRQTELKVQMEQELAQFAAAEEEKERAALQREEAKMLKKQELDRLAVEAKLKEQLDAATDLDAARIMAEHQLQQKRQQSVFDEERKIKQEKMKARLRDKKARKQAELAGRMNRENDSLLADKQQMLRDQRKDALWDSELLLVQQRLDAEGSPDVNRVKAVVQNVIESRFNQELLDLASDMLGAKVRAIQTALGPVNSRWEAELSNVQGTSQEAAIQRQLKDEVSAVRKSVSKKFEFDSETAEVALKKTHLEETLRMVAAAAPQFADQVRGKIDAINNSSIEATQNDSEARMQSLLQMKGDLAMRKQEEIDVALADVDAQSEKETRQEQTKLHEQISKLQKQKQNAIYKKTNEQELLELQASSENEKKAMQMSHRAEMMDFVRLLDEEESRQVSKLRSKFQQRQDSRLHKRREFERQLRLQFKQHEDALAAEMGEVQQAKTACLAALGEELDSFAIEYQVNDSANDELATKLESMAMKKTEREPEPAAAAAAATPVMQQGDMISPNQFLDEMQIQITKPLMSRIESIESLLLASGANMPGGRDYYTDNKDIMWKQARGTQVVPVEDGQLSTMQEAVFKQAQGALAVLPQGMHRIRSIVPVKELPVTVGSSNAFSESYNFDPSSGKLAIRAERLNDTGQMMTILAHANAHIQCGTMDSDQDPRFQREFYSTVNSLLLSLHSNVVKKISRQASVVQKYDSQRGPETALNILADHQIAANQQQVEQQRQQSAQNEQLGRKLTERSAKREAQVRSIMKSKLSGGSARVTKNQARAQKNQIKKLFDAVDSDHNGALDSAEVSGLLELLGVILSESERKDLAEQFGNERVEFDLFYQWYSN